MTHLFFFMDYCRAGRKLTSTQTPNSLFWLPATFTIYHLLKGELQYKQSINTFH